MKKIKYEVSINSLEGVVEVDNNATHDEVVVAILENIFNISYKEE